MDVFEIKALVTRELAQIKRDDAVREIKSLLVSPRREDRAWDYGKPNQTLPCWIVLEDRDRNVCIAHCHEGFGPENPWGIMFISGPSTSMGMDSAWFSSLEEAFGDLR